jgi:8-oxo-dGTP pyrophosphatase MutT (NUDIX family)
MTLFKGNASVIVALNPEDGEVLGASRRGKPDEVGVLGGKEDDGETALECAMREFFEESGVKLKDKPILVMQEMDSTGYFTSAYLVVSKRDIDAIVKAYKGAVKEIEPGIFVSYNPWTKLLSGPFAEFNAKLVSNLMALLAQRVMVSN